MDLNTAKNIAIAVGYKLQPHCEKLNIAGSIRRRKPEVKDIELVAIAKKQPIGLFLDKSVVIPEFVDVIKSLGTPIKGNPDGRYMQIALHEGINLDLFLPDPDDYYRQYAIRTGSADYAARVIAGGWVAKGWCGSDKGLRKITDCQRRISGGKNQWICINNKAEKPPVWTSEADFFAWLGVEWVRPEQRL